jgi:hypothetical protein
MQRNRWLYLLPLILLMNTLVYQAQSSSVAQEMQTTATPTAFVPSCITSAAMLEQTATPEVTPEATMVATSEMIATAEVVDQPLVFLDFEPYDLRFNPNADNPFAVIMNFTLFFHNVSGETLEVRRPQFQLAIEGLEWGELASTDFQMGRMQIDATQGIALQSLTLLRNATELQLAVLECIRLEYPVDLELTGTIDTYPNDVLQTLSVEILVEDVVIAGE